MARVRAVLYDSCATCGDASLDPSAVWMFKSAVSGLNLFGYFIAFLAVCW